MKEQLDARSIAYDAISEMETQIADLVTSSGMDRDPMVAEVMTLLGGSPIKPTNESKL